jgi:hypothetical protein
MPKLNTRLIRERHWIMNDGGRSNAGYKGQTNDCAVRAIAIATGRSYRAVYNDIDSLAKDERITRRRPKQGSASSGVYRKTIDRYMKSIGWTWIPVMGIGTGCTMHLKATELPKGRIIARLSSHVVAVIDGIVHDISDCTRGGTRCVYGYWTM